MANYQTLKAAINAVIKANGNKEITGTVLNEVLLAMVNSLGAGYQFAGVATPSTNPGTPDQKVFYIASQAGTYNNFGNVTLPAGLTLFKWKGSWTYDVIFVIDDEPTVGSNNLVKSGGVAENKSTIKLKVIAFSGIVAQLQVGEYGFNLGTNKVIYKTSDSYLQLDPKQSTLYLYNDILYEWNGTELVDVINNRISFELINNSIIVQGGLSGQGTPISSAIRIRTENYIYGKHRLVLPEGFIVYALCYYSEDTKTFDSISYPGTRIVDFGIDNHVVKLSIAKDDTTASIKPEDVKSSLVLEQQNDVISILETETLPLAEQFIILNSIIEQGGLSSQGVPINSTVRVRTGNFIYGKHRLVLPEGFVVFSVVYYAQDTKTFDSALYPQTRIVNFGVDNYVVKLTIAKADTTANIKPEDIKSSLALELENEKIAQLESSVRSVLPTTEQFVILNSIIEQGAISSYGNPMDSAVRVRTRDFISGKYRLVMPDGFIVYAVYVFNKSTHALIETQYPRDSVLNINTGNNLIKLTFAKTDSTQNITPEDIKGVLTLETLSKRIEDVKVTVDDMISSKRSSMVKFNFDHTLKDVSSILANIQTSPSRVIFQQVYNYFDGLVSQYSDYITRVDAAAEVGLSYPRYANGIGSGDAEYEETPAYKTYMYKFLSPNNDVYSANNRRRKLLITGGTHGNELASPINLCIFAKNLCDGFISDPNFYKLRAAFDIYIIPCLNGYGMQHVQRCNANLVDINRNFPCSNWEQRGTKGPNGDYTGDTAGSEFETQLMMAITNLIQPDMCVDHHNYGDGLNGVYTYLYNLSQLNLAMDSAVDMTIAYQTSMSQYFGTDYNSQLFGDSTSAPKELANNITSTMGRWWFENNIKFPAIVEISNSLNWLNGEIEHGQDPYGNNTMKVGEYCFRIQLLHYCQWVIDNTL